MKRLLFALLALPFALAHAAGLDVRGEMSFFAELYPRNSIVTMLVVKGKMRSHLTGLMGEPVLNHQIRLDPYVSVFVRLPDGRIRSMAELPPEIERAAQKIRFTLVGSLILGSTSPQYHMKTFIPFDSGASVTPAEGTSFNVPGSPSWGRLVRTEVCGDAFLDDKTARQIAAGFEKKEVWLASADMCSDKVVIDDTGLREAIAKACNAKGQGDNLPAWCPTKPAKEDKPERAKKDDKPGKDVGAGKPGKTDEKPGSTNALDELDKQELARTAPPPPPAPPPVKQPEPKPTPAAPVQVAAAEPATKGGKVIFAEDFKVPKGWQGRYETIESPGCAYLGANLAGIHMAFSPGGPVWREVSGFTPGQTYEISFEVRTLDPVDAGKANFQIDDKVLHTITKNGKASVTFKASQPTHRVKFDWKVQTIKAIPIHVTNLLIREPEGAAKSRTVFKENFTAPSGWQGRTDAMQTPSCPDIGLAQGCVRMDSIEPLPRYHVRDYKLYRDIEVEPGLDYVLSYDVVSKGVNQLWDQPQFEGKALNESGHYSTKFSATRKTRRLIFSWKGRHEPIPPVYVYNIVVERTGPDALPEYKRYLGMWGYRPWPQAFDGVLVQPDPDGKPKIAGLFHGSGMKILDELNVSGSRMTYALTRSDKRYYYEIDLDSEKVTETIETYASSGRVLTDRTTSVYPLVSSKKGLD